MSMHTGRIPAEVSLKLLMHNSVCSGSQRQNTSGLHSLLCLNAASIDSDRGMNPLTLCCHYTVKMFLQADTDKAFQQYVA